MKGEVLKKLRDTNHIPTTMRSPEIRHKVSKKNHSGIFCILSAKRVCQRSGCPFPSAHSRAPEFANQDHAQTRLSNSAHGNTQDMEATLAKLLRKECHTCSEIQRPCRLASIFLSDCHLSAMDAADKSSSFLRDCHLSAKDAADLSLPPTSSAVHNQCNRPF